MLRMGFSFNRILDFFVVVLIVEEVSNERGFNRGLVIQRPLDQIPFGKIFTSFTAHLKRMFRDSPKE